MILLSLIFIILPTLSKDISGVFRNGYDGLVVSTENAADKTKYIIDARKDCREPHIG